MAVVSVEDTCIMCPRKGDKRCNTCKSASYCSSECQALDWKNHKLLCKTFILPRPKRNMKRALYFPGGERPGRFEWIEVKPDENTGETFDIFDMKKYLGEDYPDRETSVHSQIQARDMIRGPKHRVEFFCRTDTPLQADNQGVVDFTRAHACGPCWRGPVLAMSSLDDGDSAYQYRDMDMFDIRHAADHFSTSHRGRGTLPRNVLVLASVVSSPHDLAEGKAPYSERVVNGADPVFYSEGSGIANLLGIPLLVRKDVRPDNPERHLSDGLFRTEQAMLLKRDIVSMSKEPVEQQQYNPDDLPEELRALGIGTIVMEGIPKTEDTPGFGSSPPTWSGNNVGRIIVARADGKPLVREHVEVFCEYVKQCVEPLLQTAIKGLDPKAKVDNREDILQKVNKAAFLQFFDRYRAGKAAVNDVWKYLPSPYDIDSARIGKEDIAKAYHEQAADGVLPWNEVSRNNPRAHMEDFLE